MLVQAALLALSVVQAPTAEAAPQTKVQSLTDARAGFTTKLVREDRQQSPLEAPPEGLFSLIHYDAPLGPTQAYVSKVAGSAPRAAIVWLTGGFPVARGGSVVWMPRDPGNEQSAAAYRNAGIVMMFPTVRGTAMNPGNQELMMGEVDDVIAAARHLANLACVDPERIYLGGHSTGGSLALLVAERTDMFKAAFCFGPSQDFAAYGADDPWPFETNDTEEWRLRSPIHFLAGVRTPTYVIEGQYGRSDALKALDAASDSPLIISAIIPHANHFDPLHAVNSLLAERVLASAKGPFLVSPEEIVDAYASFWLQARRASDRRSIEAAANEGVVRGSVCRISFRVTSWKRERIERGSERLKADRFTLSSVIELEDEGGDAYFEVEASQIISLTEADVDRVSDAVAHCVGEHRLNGEAWTVSPIF